MGKRSIYDLRRASLAAAALLFTLACAGGDSDGSGSPTGPGTTSPPPPPPPPDSVIAIDAGHNNFHTADGRYRPFANTLQGLGFRIRSPNRAFQRDSLEMAHIWVISNALAPQDVDDWTTPISSAFTAGEVEALRSWVEDGGSLLLIADHMPFPAAAAQLAAAFDVRFSNGFAWDSTQLSRPVTCLRGDQVQIFRRSDGGLADHAITRGRNDQERIDSVATFTGQAFEPGDAIAPLLTFGEHAVNVETDTAWEFTGRTRMSAEGWLQGAVREYGQGRVAFFGEAAMFTTQTCGNNVPMGYNAPQAGQNQQLLVNLIRWLSRDL